MINANVKHIELVKSICVYGDAPDPGCTYDFVLLEKVDDKIQSIGDVYCHAIMPDGSLLLSDAKHQIFFDLTDGWGTVGDVICGISNANYYDFGKESVTYDDISNEILMLKNRLQQKPGFCATMAISGNLKFLNNMLASLMND